MMDSSQNAMVRDASPTGHQECASPKPSPKGGGGGCESDGSGVWTFQENKRFENALAILSGPVDFSTLQGFVEAITPDFPGKSVEQVWLHLKVLWHDVKLIESGQVMFPEHWTVDEEGGDSDDGGRPVDEEGGDSDDGGRPSAEAALRKSKGKSKKSERKRGIAWTKEEHERFLRGLEIFGKGDWKSISKYFVITKTPTQVASHAQKYFNRLDRTENQKLRRSINDTHSISNIRGIAFRSTSPPSGNYTSRK
ncbi:hypothetical protein BT93_G1836 [Corymbia citriodora subsp. variegata]|nr:hypothetical protein BT93_G1836 [Corymbia citriodora subsp. variegata]